MQHVDAVARAEFNVTSDRSGHKTVFMTHRKMLQTEGRRVESISHNASIVHH